MTAITRTVRVGSSHGLHARPAKLFAQAAKESGIPVTIASRFVTIINVIPIKTIGMISQLAALPTKMLSLSIHASKVSNEVCMGSLSVLPGRPARGGRGARRKGNFSALRPAVAAL